jgi:hypothetical protein
MIRLVIALAIGLLLAGCGKRVAPGAPPGSDGFGVATAQATAMRGTPMMLGPQTCPKDAGVPGVDGSLPNEPASIPDDFTTAWVLRCRTEVRDLPDKGNSVVLITERADGSASELVAELRKPSDPRTSNPCTLEMVVAPQVLLVDASGKAILPIVPTDSCGKPRREALAALTGMTFRVLSETPLNQIQVPQAAATACRNPSKDLIAVETQAQPGPAKQVFSVVTKDVTICVYQSDGAAGKLISGRTIGDGALVESLDKAGPAAACAAAHTRFATVSPADGSNGVMVELDGCHRMLRADHTLGQLDAATVAKIAG